MKPLTIGKLLLKNPILRSATFEGSADVQGCHGEDTLHTYSALAASGIGGIITGFMAVNMEGRAMQPGQGGLYSDEQEKSLKFILDKMKKYNTAVIVQLAHCGRQTSSIITGKPVLGAGTKPSPYFRSHPRELSDEQIQGIIRDFGLAAKRAKRAGAQAVQIHGAHGYLVHQFLSPRINRRKDRWGIDPGTGMGTLLLKKIIDEIASQCGPQFSIWVKISHHAQHRDFQGISFKKLIDFLDKEAVDLIEISYGTMENPLGIFRGNSIPERAILKYNPRYSIANPFLRKVFSSFLAPYLKRSILRKSSAYNFSAAQAARTWTKKPIMLVGGIDSRKCIQEVLDNGINLIGLCRPLIADPGAFMKIIRDPNWKTTCVYCNLCVVYCDTNERTKCHQMEYLK